MTKGHLISNAELISIVREMVTTAQAQPGVTEVEVGGSTQQGLSAKVRMGSVDSVIFNRDKSLSVNVYKGKQQGSVSITDLTTAAIDDAIAAACRIAEYTEADPYAGLPEQQYLAQEIPDLDLSHPAGITAEQAIVYATECEAAALSYNSEIANSNGGSFSSNEGFYVYGNSLGFLAGYPTTSYSSYASVIAARGGNMQTDHEYTVAREMHGLDKLSAVGESAAEKALARLGARKIDTCKAPVLFTPEIAMGFWHTLIEAISGGNLYRESSFLLNTLHEQIFPQFVKINEQPHLLKALGSAPFDSEGVATKAKSIIQDGVLQTYILGTYSARRLKMQTTGNAGGVHNMAIEPGTQSYKQLLKTMGTGLVVTQLLGDGTDIVTGDYSHGACGFWVENGAMAYPVEEITIAGNLRDMFAHVVAIGNDVDRRSNIITGSVLLEQMTIAGN